MEKSIIVLRNGGHAAEYENWAYGENVMTTVNVYEYLGIYLSTRLTFLVRWKTYDTARIEA